jgi:quercetin dioxygenase-like cupin family protein
MTSLGDEEIKAEEGDTLIIPPMSTHNILEAGPEGVEYLAIFPVGNRWYHPDGRETPPLAPA